MSPLAVFGITSDGLNLVVNLLLLFLVVFWIAAVYWTYADARRRIADPMLVGCATAASIFPFAGTMVYMIVRPPEYLDDVRERELEIATAEVRLAAIESLTCSYCNVQIEQSFLRCPSCLRRLKEPCATCHKPLDPTWKICPYCESEIGQPAPQPRRRARPREAPVAAVAPERQRQAVASRAPRRAAPDVEPAAASAQRQPAASAGQAQRQPASPGAQRAARQPPRSGNSQRAAKQAPRGESSQREAKQPPRGESSQREAKQPPRNASPAADGQARREGRTNQPSGASQRPPVRDKAQRPSADNGQERAGPPPAKRPASPAASDAVTAEQRVTRPRTRPPSAG